MLNANGVGIFVRLVDANGKTAEEIANMYKDSCERDPLGRVAFCTDAETDPRMQDRFEKIILAYEKPWGDYGYLVGDILETEVAHDPKARKGFKRKILGSFSDLLPREFDREMKSTWILMDNVQELEPEQMTGMKCVLHNDLVEAESMLNNVEQNVNFTYFVNNQ